MLMPMLIGVLVADGVLAAFAAARGKHWPIVRQIVKPAILTPGLLLVISAGGAAVFGLMFVRGHIYEDVLWVRTLELIVPLATMGYAIWRLVVATRQALPETVDWVKQGKQLLSKANPVRMWKATK